MNKYKIIYHFNDGTTDEDNNSGNYFTTREKAYAAGMLLLNQDEFNIHNFEIVEIATTMPVSTTYNDIHYCYKCGSELGAGVLFCPYCGTPLKKPVNNSRLQPDDNHESKINRVPTGSSYDSTKTLFMVLCLIGSTACLAGIFMPYVSTSFLGSSISKSLQELTNSGGDFPFFVAIAVLGIVLSFFKNFLGCVIDGVAFIVLHSFDTKDYWSRLSGTIASKGVGYYAMVGGAICLILFGLVGFVENIKYKRSLK